MVALDLVGDPGRALRSTGHFLRRARRTLAAEVELDPDAQESAADARRASASSLVASPDATPTPPSASMNPSIVT